MKHAIVRSSALSTRWDAGYQIARVMQGPVVSRLMALPDEQFNKMMELVPEHQHALSIVARGNNIMRRTKEQIKNYSKEEKAVFLSIALQDIHDLELQAVKMEQQAPRSTGPD